MSSSAPANWPQADFLRARNPKSDILPPSWQFLPPRFTQRLGALSVTTLAMPLTHSLVLHSSMKKLITISFILLSGCSIFPETKEELLQTGTKSPEYCFNDESELVARRVETYLSKCFRPSYVRTGYVTGFANNQQLKKEVNNGATGLSVYSPSGADAGYFLHALISKGDAICKTRMSITAYNFAWERHFGRLKESAEGNEPGCGL